MSDLKNLALAASKHYFIGDMLGYKWRATTFDYVAHCNYSTGEGRLAAARDSTAVEWARRQLS